MVGEAAVVALVVDAGGDGVVVVGLEEEGVAEAGVVGEDSRDQMLMMLEKIGWGTCMMALQSWHIMDIDSGRMLS